MTNTTILLFLIVAIVSICLSIKFKSRSLRIITSIICLIFVLTVLIPNRQVLISPFTPVVHGKIIDAETKKPLAGINIKAGWYAKSGSVGGGSGWYYKIYKTKSNNNG